MARAGIADRVGNVDGGRALLDHRLEHPAEEIQVRAATVLRRELDVGAGLLGETHGESGRLEHLLGRHAELLLHVQRAGGDEDMDAPGIRAFQRIDGALDVGVVGGAQPEYRRVLHRVGKGAHRLEVAVGRSREAGLDDIDLHALQRPGDAQLLVARHRGAGALLAVAHGGVENDQTFFGHGNVLAALVGPVNYTDCRQEFLAGGPQQQAAQREKREREKNSDHLLHAKHYRTISRWSASRCSAWKPGFRPPGTTILRTTSKSWRRSGIGAGWQWHARRSSPRPATGARCVWAPSRWCWYATRIRSEPSTTPAGTAARCCAPRSKAASPASGSSARTTPGPTILRASSWRRHVAWKRPTSAFPIAGSIRRRSRAQTR